MKQNGHTPTLMDYSRFNYVAQPEDGIAPADLIPKIGQYDKWATMWGYAPIPAARTPDDEQPTLDAWAREQDADAVDRFSTAQAGSSDPGDNTEAVGDIDAVQATALGLKNLQRVAGMLLTATTTKPGDPYDELDRGLRAAGRAVDARDEPRDAARRRLPVAAETHRSGRASRFTPVPRAPAGRSRAVPADNAFRRAAFMIEAGASPAHRARRRDGPRAHRAELGDELPASDRPDRPAGRAGGARRRRGLHADQFLARSPRRHLE